MNLLEIVYNVITLYSYLLIARIILSWIPALQYNGVADILRAITDPYLNLFRGLPFTSLPGIDFSPIVAIFFLNFVQNLIARFAQARRIGLDLVLQFLLATINSVVTTILFVIILLAVIRLVSLFISRRSHPILVAFDNLLRPATQLVSSVVAKGRIVSYRLVLAIVALGALLLMQGVRVAVAFLFALTLRLPF